MKHAPLVCSFSAHCQKRGSDEQPMQKRKNDSLSRQRSGASLGSNYFNTHIIVLNLNLTTLTYKLGVIAQHRES
jgi:hypothetical protein